MVTFYSRMILLPASDIWMELEIIMLSEISQLKKPNIEYSCSFVEPRPKMMVVI
jgi:hypothetical protein